MFEPSNRKELAKMFGKLGFKAGAEVGVAQGKYSILLCENIPGLKLLLVDPWKKYEGNNRGGPQEQHDNNWTLAHERLKDYDVEFLKGFSMDVVKGIKDEVLDFVYIDGHHSFDFVMEDLINWGKKVKKGGIISGHDYYEFRWAGVIPAVDAYCLAHDLELHLTSKDFDHGEVSFWMVKK